VGELPKTREAGLYALGRRTSERMRPEELNHKVGGGKRWVSKKGVLKAPSVVPFDYLWNHKKHQLEDVQRKKEKRLEADQANETEKEKQKFTR